MAEQVDDRSFLSGIVTTGKDFVAMLRDALLLLIALLLIVWPVKFNAILADAGFDEGSFAGLKWKARITKSDDALLRAQAIIKDYKDQNDSLRKALSEALSRTATAPIDLRKLEASSTQLDTSAAKVLASVESNLSANAPLVQKTQTAAGTVVTWGVVWSGDQNLDSAKYEIQTIAPKLGLTNAAIYYRQGSYRSVATTTDRLEAESLLNKAKQRRKDSYIVNMANWCPNPTDKNGYFDCEVF